MKNEKKSFIIYQSWEESFNLLNCEEQSQFIKNLFMFHRGKEPLLNTPMLQIFWKSIEYNLYENDKRYKTSVENGKLGGAPKGNKNALKNKYDLEQPNQPNSTKEQPNQLWVKQNNLNDNVNGNDDVNVNVNVNGNDDVNVDGYVSVSVNVDDSVEETYQQFCNRNQLQFGSESILLFQKSKLK
jgi:hypothetical protein